MTKLIAILSFIIGSGFGVILMSCFFIAKESDKDEEKFIDDKR